MENLGFWIVVSGMAIALVLVIPALKMIASADQELKEEWLEEEEGQESSAT